MRARDQAPGSRQHLLLLLLLLLLRRRRRLLWQVRLQWVLHTHTHAHLLAVRATVKSEPGMTS
jgi:hypothetical protein